MAFEGYGEHWMEDQLHRGEPRGPVLVLELDMIYRDPPYTWTFQLEQLQAMACCNYNHS